MWDSQYITIEKVEAHNTDIHFAFADGSTVKLPRLNLFLGTHAADTLEWARADIDEDGLYVRVPGDPADLHLSWQTIRQLSDPEFARHMADLAAEEAKNVGLRIRELRKQRGFSQADLADHSGLAQSRVSRAEKGKTDLTISALWRLLSALVVSPVDFVESPKPSLSQPATVSVTPEDSASPLATGA